MRRRPTRFAVANRSLRRDAVQRAVLFLVSRSVTNFVPRCALMGEIQHFTQNLTARELEILKLGLEASHLEESIVHGNWTRAEAHAESCRERLDLW